jgi:hypothetical protein
MAFGHPFKRGHRPGKTDSTSSLGLIDQSMSRWVEYMHTLEKSVQTHPNAQKCYKDSTGLAHPGGPRGQRPLHWHRDQAAGIHIKSDWLTDKGIQCGWAIEIREPKCHQLETEYIQEDPVLVYTRGPGTLRSDKHTHTHTHTQSFDSSHCGTTLWQVICVI